MLRGMLLQREFLLRVRLHLPEQPEYSGNPGLKEELVCEVRVPRAEQAGEGEKEQFHQCLWSLSNFD
jgi:hypothetical protein